MARLGALVAAFLGAMVASAAAQTITANKNNVNAGAVVQFSLTGGFGGATDWLGLFPIGAPPEGYIDWVYVPQGASSFVWNVQTMPPANHYEVRLFRNDGFVEAARSQLVTVLNVAKFTIASPIVNPGDPLDVFVNNAPQNATDWIGIYAANADVYTFVGWAYIPAGVSSYTHRFTMPAAPGDYKFRLLANDGFALIAESPVVQVNMLPPNMVAGPDFTQYPGNIQITAWPIPNLVGVGAPGHRIGLHLFGQEGAAALQEVPPGVGAHIWTIQSPPVGQWFFRFYPRFSFYPLATSNVVTVTAIPGAPSPPPPPPPAPPPSPPPEPAPPPPPPAPTVGPLVYDLSNTDWVAGPNIPGYPNFSPGACCTYDGVTFAIANADVDYMTRPAPGPLPLGGTIVARFRLTGGPLISSGGSSVAGIYLHIQRAGDNWSGQGAFQWFRGWSINGIDLANQTSGEFTVVADLVADQWTGVLAAPHGDMAGLLANPAQIGWTFADDAGKGHGVKSPNGGARIEVLEYKIHGPR